MRILQVIPRLNPRLGGGVAVISNISRHFVKRGHEVTILTTDRKIDKNFAQMLIEEGVSVVTFKHWFDLGLFIPSPSMNKWVKDNLTNYDIVHLHGSRSYQNNVIFKYATKYNIPYVLQAHGSMLRIVNKKTLKWLYDIVWGYSIYKHAAKFIALSSSEVEAYKKMGIAPQKIEIVPNGVDLKKFKKLPPKGTFKKKYGINSNQKIILYLGRLHVSKGIDLLVDAFSLIKDEIPDSVLVLAGPDDGFRSYLIKKIYNTKISDRVVFTGYVSEMDKLAAFIDSEVLVTPRFYGFPIVFAEALACGLPIITTNAGDILEWLDNNVGYIVDYNPLSIGNAILKILESNELRITFGKNARYLVESEFNWENITEKLEKMYLYIIEKEKQ